MPLPSKREIWDDDLRAMAAALIERGIQGMTEADAAFAGVVARRAAAIANALEHERVKRQAKAGSR